MARQGHLLPFLQQYAVPTTQIGNTLSVAMVRKCSQIWIDVRIKDPNWCLQIEDIQIEDIQIEDYQMWGNANFDDLN